MSPQPFRQHRVKRRRRREILRRFFRPQLETLEQRRLLTTSLFSAAPSNADFAVTVNAVNDNPTLDALNDLRIDVDASEQTISLTGISAGGGESQPLRVTTTSDNISLVPAPAVTYTSAEATGTLKLTPVADQSGTATITVTVEDGGLDNDLDTDFELSLGDEYGGDDLRDILTVDLDHDGDLDLISASYTSARLSVRLNDGSGQFGDVVYYQSLDTVTGGIATADFNGDGHMDLVLAGERHTGKIVLHPGNGTGGFGDRYEYAFETPGGRPMGIIAEDLTGDGVPDVALVDNYRDKLFILPYNRTTATFSNFQEITTGNNPDSPISVTDIDGDGDYDLVVGCNNGAGVGSVQVYTNNGVGTFTFDHEVPEIAWPNGTVAGDINNDGYDDVIVAAVRIDQLVYVLLNDGNGTLSKSQILPIASDTQHNRLELVDYNLDGWLDLAMVEGESSKLKLYQNTEGFFSLTTELTPGVLSVGVHQADIDNDGDPDLIVSHKAPDRFHDDASNTIRVVKNRWEQANATFSRTFDVTVRPVNDVPVITILGQSPLVLEGVRDNAYNDPGHTAWDVEDGDLSDQVEVSGAPADLGTTGEWQLGFNVVDAEGVAAVEQTRTVSIVDTLPPVTSLYLDGELIQQSDNSQLGVGGVPNTDPNQGEPTDSTSVGAAVKLATPIDRKTGLVQPDGSLVNSRQLWVETWAAAAEVPPELPTASSWDKLEDPVATTTTIVLVDLDGNGQEMLVEEVDFSQRSTYMFDYTAQDSSGNYAEQLTFALILNDRTPPVIQLGGEEIQIVEHGSVWTWGAATATDNIDGVLDDQLRYHIENLTDATLVGTDLTYTEAASLLTTAFVADYQVQISVSDNAGFYGQNAVDNMAIAYQAISVRNTLNEDPTLGALSDLSIDEDAPQQTVDLSGIKDGDDSSQTLRVTASSSNPTLLADPEVSYTPNETTGSLTLTPTPDQHGETIITVTVTDAGLDGDFTTPEDNASFSRAFTVTIHPINDNPTVAEVVTTTDADTPLLISLPFYDIDGDPLSIQIVSLDVQEDVQVEIDEDNLVLHYDPTASAALQALDKTDSLQEQIVLSVSDGQGGEATATVTIDVVGVTDWQNPHNPMDVNGDGTVSTIDIVLVINWLNLKGSHSLADVDDVPPPWVDTNGDGSLSAIDAVRIVNWINLHGIAEGEQTILFSPTLAQQQAARFADNLQTTTIPRRTLEPSPTQQHACHEAVWQEPVWQEQGPAQHVQPRLTTEAFGKPPSSTLWAEHIDALLAEAAESDDDFKVFAM